VAKYHADLRTRERNVSGSSAASMARRRVSEEEQEESNTSVRKYLIIYKSSRGTFE